MASTFLGGKRIHTLTYRTATGDKDIAEAYLNGRLVFTKELELTLPAHTSPVNLRSFIDANNPKGYRNIVITNTRVQPSIITGDINDLNVTLINNGEIQGTPSTGYGLKLQSPLKLINNGYIRGKGGDGGKGGKGANDTYTSYEYNEQYKFTTCHIDRDSQYWVATFTQSNGVKSTYAKWGTKYREMNWDHFNTSWFTIPGLSGEFRMKKYKTTRYCSYNTKFYSIERRTSVTKTRIGGDGGNGGLGRAFNRNATAGQQGKPSNPAGGNSGGAGGAGGSWGVNGANGARGGGNGANGSPGGRHGYALENAQYLKSGSKEGNLVGGKVALGRSADEPFDTFTLDDYPEG